MLQLPAPMALADEQEWRLQTAYLVNIAKFVTWPDNTQDVRLCVGELSPLYGYADGLQNVDLADGRKLKVAGLEHGSGDCQLVFLDQGLSEEEVASVRASAGPGVLLISNRSDAFQGGDAIQFFVRNLKLRIALNEEVIQKAEYKLSSKLMRLARKLN
ncbi:MAG: YfiR family protein [Parahaliea sp.]